MNPFKSYGKVDDIDQERLAVKKRTMRRMIVISVASVVLVAIIASVAAGVVISNRNNGGAGSAGFQATNKALKATCDITLYPTTCISSLSSYASSSNAGPKELANIAVMVALDEAKKTSDWIQKMYESTHNMALLDCAELMNATIEQLNSSSALVQSFDLASLQDVTGDVQTWLSASQTNLDTCLDGVVGMSPNEQVKGQIQSTLNNLTQIASNSLAIVKGISTVLSSLNIPGFPARRLLSDPEDELQSLDDDFPKWLSAGDRRLLQKTTTVTPNVTVASDGTGKYKKIQEAIDAAPESSRSRYVIKVKQGTYYENVVVPSGKPLLTIIGDGMDRTIVSGNRSVGDNSTTFASATFAAVGKGFIARDIQFINTAGPQKFQAVALRSGADKSIFYRCKIVANQDTLYAHSLRQFFKDSEIWGTVDFIFGNAAVVLQNCTIRARKPLSYQENTLTAQGRTDPNMNTGISIHKCNVVPTADLIPMKTVNPTYLGRPWKLYSRTVVMHSQLADIIAPAGWLYWNATFALDTLFYREFNNSGPGSVTKNRVNWPGYRATTSANVVIPFTVPKFIGSSWIKSAGIAYDQTL